VAAIPLIFKLDVHVHKNRESMIKTAKAVGRMLDVNIFFLVEVVVGVCWGFHINYIAIYLDTELKASKTFLGQKLAIFGRRCWFGSKNRLQGRL
jgi:MFS_1 like family